MALQTDKIIHLKMARYTDWEMDKKEADVQIKSSESLELLVKTT